MRTCPNCGANVADTDDFCGNCGTYLGWLQPEPGESEAELPTPAEPAAPEPHAVAPEQPHAVAPARPVAQRRTTAPQATAPAANGPPCKVCGTANPLDAKFCRRCGASLTEAAATGPTRKRRRGWPRWLRLPGGGESPWPRRIVALVVLAALIIAGIFLYPSAANLVQDIRDKLSHATPISPVRTAASGAAAGHPVSAAIDGATNTYWGAPSVGASADFTFAAPFRLLGVIIHSGASTVPQDFTRQARPTAVDLVVTTSTGATRTLSIPLADKPGPQNTDTGISDVTAVRLIVRAATPGQPIAVGEIEFFKRS